MITIWVITIMFESLTFEGNQTLDASRTQNGQRRSFSPYPSLQSSLSLYQPLIYLIPLADVGHNVFSDDSVNSKRIVFVVVEDLYEI